MREEDFEKRFEKDLLSSFKCHRLQWNIWFSLGTVSIKVEMYWFLGVFGSFWFFLNSRQTVEKIAKKSNAQWRYWNFSHASNELYKVSLAPLVLAWNSNKHPRFLIFAIKREVFKLQQTSWAWIEALSQLYHISEFQIDQSIIDRATVNLRNKLPQHS